MILFSKAKMVLCCAKYTYPKTLSRIAPRSLGAKPDSRLCYRVRFVQTFSLPLDCKSTVLLQVLQNAALPLPESK